MGLHELIRITTRRASEFVDLTDRLAAIVEASGLDIGFLNVQTLHTTTAIVVNEHEPLLLTDFEGMLERVAPRHGAYEHDAFGRRTVNMTPDERANGHAHCRALMLAPAVTLNIAAGRLVIGRWQRVFFVELDGPQERRVSVAGVGAAAAHAVGHPRTSWTECRFSEALER